jgi:hypothetical protein
MKFVGSRALSSITLLPTLVAVLSFAALGCESGLEIAGVADATASRGADSRVTVQARLDCMLVEGLPRVDETCDADGRTVCVHARWYSTTALGKPVAAGDTCQKVDHVRSGPVVTVVSAGPVPTDRTEVIVYADDQREVSRDDTEPAQPMIVMLSP